MTISQKAAVSLLIAVLLFGGFSVLAFIGLFDIISNRFYNPSVTTHLSRDITQSAEVIDKVFTEAQERFSETLKTDLVKRSFLSNQNTETTAARSKIFNLLIDSFYGVQWIRFLDSEGQRLLFSTYGPDILNGDKTFPVYADYSELNLPYEIIAVPEDGTPKYTFDERAGSVIFSFPVYDSFDIYCGTALFSLSIDAISARLTSEGRIKHGENITVISNPAGLLFGMPASGESTVLSQVSSSWARLALSPRIRLAVQKTNLDSPPSNIPLVPERNIGSDGPWQKVLISTRTSHGFFVGRLVNEELFLFPPIMKIILLLAFFMTTYLIIFLLFNLKQDPLIVVQNRLKQLQISLIEQFYERKSEADWTRWIKELEHRREEVRALLKRGIKADSRPQSYRDNIAGKSADVDTLINKSWDELLAMLGSRRSLSITGETDIDEEKIASVLQKLLEAARTAAPSTVSPSALQPSSDITADGKTGLLNKAAPFAEMGNIESVEEIEILEELDEAEKHEGLGITASDIDYLAKQIEFSPDIEPETADGELFDKELEIVSPFSTMVFDSSPTGGAEAAEEGKLNETLDKNEDNELGINAGTDVIEGLPLITMPFLSISNSAEIETLETFNAEDERRNGGGVIREREGVNYISEDVLTPSPEFSATLNREFKELVDEVTK